MKSLRKIHQKGETSDSIFTKAFKLVSSCFASFFLSKNIFNLTEELHVILESWAKNFQKIVVEYVFKIKDEKIE